MTQCSRMLVTGPLSGNVAHCDRAPTMELDGQGYCLVCFQELRLDDEYGSALGTGGRSGMRTIVLPWSEVEGLLEYSCSLPTGTTLGKRWRARDYGRGGWLIAQYQWDPDPTRVAIAWQRVVLLESLAAVAVWALLWPR